MQKKPSDRLSRQLEGLFSGVGEPLARTGPLSPERLDQAGRSAPAGWAWESDLEGRCVSCTPEIQAVLGLSPEAAAGRKISALGLTEASARLLDQALAGGQEIHDLRLEGEGPDSARLVLQVNAMPRATKRGETLGYRGVTRVVERQTEAPAPAARRTSLAPASPPSAVSAMSRRWAQAPGYVDAGDGPRPLEAGATPAVSATMVVPILAQDRLLGVLEFGEHESGRPWTEHDRQLVEAAAQQLALALQDARSYELTQQALEDMREADRLKTQFLANMSHELRTPLNSIIGFSRVILKGIDGPINETQSQDLAAIYNSGQHLLGLINDILDLSRIEAGKMELSFGEVDLADIVRGVMSTAVGLVKDKPIELALDLPETLPPIHGDNIRIRQVLLNLVSNATKFTERGEVGVSARVVEHGGRREVVLAVFDTGPGIRPEDQARLFEPFSQVDASATRKSGGTGLGLSICRHLVELHGGRIWVESTIGQGSTFAFSLPLQPPEGVPAEGLLPLLLAVDERPATIEQVREHLAPSGYRVHGLTQVPGAFPLARELRPDAILLSLGLAAAGAWQVLAQLKAAPETARLPVVLAGTTPDGGRGTCLGTTELVSKPFEEHELLEALRRARGAARGPFHALVVSADATLVARVRSALSHEPGASDLHAGDVQSGLEAAFSLAPDVAMLDLTAPGFEALELVEGLRRDARTRRLPLLFLLPGALEPEAFSALDERTRALLDRGPWSQAELLDELKHWLTASTGRAAG